MPKEKCNKHWLCNHKAKILRIGFNSSWYFWSMTESKKTNELFYFFYQNLYREKFPPFYSSWGIHCKKHKLSKGSNTNTVFLCRPHTQRRFSVPCLVLKWQNWTATPGQKRWETRQTNRWKDGANELRREGSRTMERCEDVTVSDRRDHNGGKEGQVKGWRGNQRKETWRDREAEERDPSFILQSLWQFSETAGERENKERRGREREGEIESASADYLSASVINVETRILLGVCVFVCVCLKALWHRPTAFECPRKLEVTAITSCLSVHILPLDRLFTCRLSSFVCLLLSSILWLFHFFCFFLLL